VPELGMNGVVTSFIISLGFAILITLLLIISFSLMQKNIYSKKELKLRLKDIYAVNIFSFTPYLFGLVFIFPVELVVLGGDIFSNNPYSFEIKPLITYILIGFELITISWSFYLIYKNIMTISLNKNYSIFFTVLYFFTWFTALYFSSKIIFTL
jgi:Zn-dependent protease with chaperone function